jgi:hypothetical protein
MNNKNLQKYWDFRNCARLRWVISLSSICARAWKLTKVPGATRRTRCSTTPKVRDLTGTRMSHFDRLDLAHLSMLDVASRLHDATLVRVSHDVASHCEISTKSPNASTIALDASVGQQRPHNASATMARAHHAKPPTEMGPPPKTTRSWPVGTVAIDHKVCLFCPPPVSISQRIA